LRAFALLALMPSVSGAYTCPSGWDGIGGTPKCLGLSSDTCSDYTCCKATGKTCLAFSSKWVGAQIVGGGCAPDDKFFDLKKTTAVVGGSASDADIKAACCTSFADAKCSDWNVMGCTGGKYKVMSNAAPADGKMSLTAAKHQELCCADMATCSSHSCSSGMEKIANPGNTKCASDAASCTDSRCCSWGATKNCASFSVAWVTAQALGGGCAKENHFFDLKKTATVVGGSQSDADVIAACCTSFADATCSDWNLMGCPAGDLKASTNSAPADGDKSLTKAKFQELCCSKPMKCADYVQAEASAALPNASPFAGTLASLMALVAVNMAGLGL